MVYLELWKGLSKQDSPELGFALLSSQWWLGAAPARAYPSEGPRKPGRNSQDFKTPVGILIL